MQNYRTYFLDQDGHISNAIDMECTDDEQAKECAKKFLSDRNAELWKGGSLIAVYTSGRGPFQAPSDQQASRECCADVAQMEEPMRKNFLLIGLVRERC